jgi:hypothetical protein
MRVLGPDDYTKGKLVTLTKGPFTILASPFPVGMFGMDEPPRQEDKSLHGRVFMLQVYDNPFLILEPVDGIGEPPEVKQQGLFSIISNFGGNWSPTAIKLDVRSGIELSEVGEEYAATFTQHFVPPGKRQPTQEVRVPRGPISKMLASPGCDCDHCDKSGNCPDEAETRRRQSED